MRSQGDCFTCWAPKEHGKLEDPECCVNYAKIPEGERESERKRHPNQQQLLRSFLAKLLMNAAYGQMGMDSNKFPSTKYVTHKQALKLRKAGVIKNMELVHLERTPSGKLNRVYEVQVNRRKLN